MITFKTIREGDSQPPSFKADEPTAVEFLNAVLASAVGTHIEHSIALTEAVVAQICSLLIGKDPAVAPLSSSVGLPAAYTVLSSLHHSQIVPAPAPGSNAIKRFANIVIRKGGGRGSA
eukprot:598904-Pleurochrysis_carterae.AAC.1